MPSCSTRDRSRGRRSQQGSIGRLWSRLPLPKKALGRQNSVVYAGRGPMSGLQFSRPYSRLCRPASRRLRRLEDLQSRPEPHSNLIQRVQTARSITARRIQISCRFCCDCRHPFACLIDLRSCNACRTGSGVGSGYKAVFRVPHGCKGSATVKLSIQIPPGAGLFNALY
jgi:Domain of unkown function (DUF1775)